MLNHLIIMSAKSSFASLKKKGSKLKCIRASDATQYWWHPANTIGKGSFGEVFKGWEEVGVFCDCVKLLRSLHRN